ncbi:bifunctional lysylphosphatidylglycerol flippase/synthetase MprF [Celeribacter neptunius]|uniref:Phosphatidylglycerol lysyltransferase n=1 Tax=Celeribacter neptunius TaxID=588602 RepID=A0A1I3K5I6_9RHOB|nr:phosphatidylglycerol lysyltransferase domain-containing protein [Celeribacter neptunius]SFI67781.1 phosphatidylglycerol lysyltransferase [Celeribacter neptunius]
MRHSQSDIEEALKHAGAGTLPASGQKHVRKQARNQAPKQAGNKTPSLTTEGDRKGLRKLLSKQALPLAVMLFFGWLLWEKAAHLDVRAVFATVATVELWQWALAALATTASFWAVGHYDRVLHAQLGTGISDAAARRSGIVAIGLSQALGFGALTGTLIRWRMLPELTLWQAARLSGAVALSFLTGWAVVAAAALLLFQPDVPWMKTLATGAIALFLIMAALSVYPPRRLVRLPWPSLRTMATVVGLAAIDTICAGLALFVMLPDALHLPLGHTIAAYLFSLGAGLIGSTPGGVGPFEATLTSLLPDIPLEPLLGAVVAFRLIYYAIPASISALVILRGPRKCNLLQEPRLVATERSPFLAPRLEQQIFAAPRAEANLLRTRDFSLLTAADGTALGLAAPIGQSLVMLSDPLAARACPSATRTALARTAARRYRMPAIYKCGARMAASARKAGWVVLPTAEEAWLTPAEFSLEGSKARQLRRYLRKAEEAGVTVTEGERNLPLDQMDRVAKEWRAARGKERGFSMGTYDRDYISCQRVFLAWQGTNLVAFVSLHETRNEMTLDLMRSGEAAPDGTVQLLITKAILAAKERKCPRLSLAAVPWQGEDCTVMTRFLRKKFLARSGAEGLRRFKSLYKPHWETLYLVAPNRLALTIAGMDILRRITAPPSRTTQNPMKAAKTATHPTLRLPWHRNRAPAK